MITKVKKAWFCQECGYESTKWLGRCSSCGAWNSMMEEVLVKEAEHSHQVGIFKEQRAKPIALSEVTFSGEARISLNNAEINRLLGGGLVEGSLVLLGGEPGIGKSTLSLQIPLHCRQLKTLYVSGEESAPQIKMRANRLSPSEHAANHCYILCETLLEHIIQHAQELNPALVIIDSIQTMYSQRL